MKKNSYLIEAWKKKRKGRGKVLTLNSSFPNLSRGIIKKKKISASSFMRMCIKKQERSEEYLLKSLA